MTKSELIKEIKLFTPTTARNFMGRSENWYDFVFAMKQTFSTEEIEEMSDKEISMLEKMHDSVSEGFLVK